MFLKQNGAPWVCRIFFFFFFFVKKIQSICHIATLFWHNKFFFFISFQKKLAERVLKSHFDEAYPALLSRPNVKKLQLKRFYLDPPFQLLISANFKGFKRIDDTLYNAIKNATLSISAQGIATLGIQRCYVECQNLLFC